MTTAWLRDLEEKVQEASERLGDLQARNDKLQKRITELEAQLEAAPDAKDVAGWTEERDDIRQRVEKLVGHLGKLLED
ncbi:MAG: cell division protein ZapB [bacterium]|nr:cell division protein ZapB [bacterium]